MLTEDYLMRMINQLLAVLLAVLGLKKSGQFEKAHTLSQQAIGELFGLRPELLDQMDDENLLRMIKENGGFNSEHLTLVAELFDQEGDTLRHLNQPQVGKAASARALRFFLEAVLIDSLPPDLSRIEKIDHLYSRFTLPELVVETRLALLDYYERLLSVDEVTLAQSGITPVQIKHTINQINLNIQ